MKKITTSMILALLSCSMLGAVSKPSSLSDGKSETEKQIQQYNAEKEAAAAAADAKESAVEGPVVVTEDVIVYTSNANQPEGNLSAFGTYFVSVKAEGSLVQLKSFVGNEKRKYWGYGAELAANANLYKDEGDNWGIDLYVPLDYRYSRIEGGNFHQFEFPAYLRPYLRVPLEGLTFTLFAEGGAGGLMTHMTDMATRTNVFWAMGGGIEIGFLNDFSITPKYMYKSAQTKSRENDVGNLNAYMAPQQEISVEFAWRFQQNMALLVSYTYTIWDNKCNSDIIKVNQDHKLGVGVRFQF